MLIWLEGNLSPQELRDKMEEDPQFKQHIFEWLESIIKCELPGTVGIVEEPEGVALSKPAIDDPHPTSLFLLQTLSPCQTRTLMLHTMSLLSGW